MTVKTKTTAPKLGNRKKSALLRATGATESDVNSFLQGLPPGILKKCSAQELAWILNSIHKSRRRIHFPTINLQHFSRRFRNTISAFRGRWSLRPTIKWTEQLVTTALLFLRGRK